jgi:hypothetical protein
MSDHAVLIHAPNEYLDYLHARIAELAGEVAHLTEGRDRWLQNCRDEQTRAINAEAEIDRLRAENERTKAAVVEIGNRLGVIVAENEQLRAVLKPFAEHWAAKGTSDENLGRSESVPVALLRRARALLADTGEGKTEGGWRALADVAAERQRQITGEQWSTAHDDAHTSGVLATAAACYAIHESNGRIVTQAAWPPKTAPYGWLHWPWDWEWFKPKDRRRNLVRAGALIIAEIERLDRLPAPPSGAAGEEKS